MALQNRMMTLVAFLQAQNCSNLPGSWQHPATMLDFLTPEYYQRIAGTQRQGEVLEIDVQAELGRRFPHDLIAAVAKGARGADLVHEVRDAALRSCGTIVWETKNTRHWHPGWLEAMVEAFAALQTGLNRERTAMERIWADRQGPNGTTARGG